VELFDYAVNCEREKAFDLYRWFLPLLRMDTVPEFVQLIKLVQMEVGMGNPRVRPPRLELTGAKLEEVQKIIKQALRARRQIANGQTVPAK
jgi:4-hydroxy-tetrahydrodipicolinate synthase